VRAGRYISFATRSLGLVAVRGPVTLWLRPRHFNVPRLRRMTGGMLIASNHESFFDPVLVGMGLPVPIYYLARRTLFRVPVFGQVIYAVGARPVSRDAVDSQSLRTMLKLLRDGQRLLMFPEGTRTRDGSLGPFKKGVAAVAVRCGVPVLPVAVAGAREAWPRASALPRPGRTAVAYGEPLDSLGADPEELTACVRAEVQRLRAHLRSYLGLAPGL
jgi:1-acyl-sn-glycerol-3-phosphate acyltransferase